MPSTDQKPSTTDRKTGENCYIGLISGTSVDGIDAALVSFTPELRLLHAFTLPMADDLAADILRVSQADALVSLDFLGSLDTRVAMAFAQAANLLVEQSGMERDRIKAIGSHGQTLRHQPRGDAPFSLQVGDGNVIAERCGIATVSDFRRRDVAAGGQGAPLVPAFHAAIFSDASESRAILNIGGIANLTLLGQDGTVGGFDTGPGNGLMDAWCLRHRGQRYDAAGAFAASGTTDPELLNRLFDEPWLALPAPKSTGRDQFHLGWLDTRLTGLSLSIEDVQATLCAFTARTVAEALYREQPATTRMLVCGGGVHNPVLMTQLRLELDRVVVESTGEHGLDPDFVEAMAFAWLARETLAGRPGNRIEVTGALGPRVLGTIHPA